LVGHQCGRKPGIGPGIGHRVCMYC
jgi:hypothetical protein